MVKWLLKIVVLSLVCGIILFEAFLEWTKTNSQFQKTDLEILRIPDKTFHTHLQIQKTELERKNMSIPDEKFQINFQNQKTELEGKNTHTLNETFHTNLQIQETDLERDTLSEQEKNSMIKEKDAATFSKEIFKLKADTSSSYKSCRQTVVDNLHLHINETVIERIANNCPKFNISSDISALFEREFMEENMWNISCVRSVPVFLKKSMPLVALASFPGSGNSWVRQILEAVTGIYTGSIYDDVLASFKGSNICPTNGQVFIVKTHQNGKSSARPNCPRKLNYEKAVLILRNPYDAIMAEFNRENGGKIGVAKKEEYANEKWPSTVKLMSDRWRTMVGFWLTKFKNPVFTMVYEQLKTHTAMETYKVMEFMNFPVTLHTLFCLTDDKNQKKQEKYLRAAKPAWLTKENLFSRYLKELVNANIAQVVDAIPSLPKIQKVIKSYAININ